MQKTVIFKQILIIALILFINVKIKSQNLYYPLGNSIAKDINFVANFSNKAINTGFKPIMKSEFGINSDSIVYQYLRKENFYIYNDRNLIFRKLFVENFLDYKKKDFSISVNPLFYLEKGYDTISTENLFINTRGIEIKGTLGKKIAYYSSFRENQAYYRPYINSWIRTRKVVPGQGATKGYFTNNQDFSMAAGYLSFTPFDWLNIQTGSDKNFIGEGYRSLLLSDNTFNYPFLKLSFFYKSLKYTTMFAEFQDFSGVYYSYHFKKHSAINYLSYSIKNVLEIGLFEGLIYKTQDTSKNYYNKFKADFFIPILGLRTSVNGFSGENKVLTGINLKANIGKYIQTYGQVASDNPNERSFTFQVGAKSFNLFFDKIKNQKLYFQVEYNVAKGSIYINPTDTLQTWTHYNQELAHPAGTNFSETFININYSVRNFSLDFKYNSLILNKSHYNSQIYQQYSILFLLIPEEYINHKIITAAWVFNPRTRLQIYAGADFRSDEIYKMTKNAYYFFGIKTGLNNFYFDF